MALYKEPLPELLEAISTANGVTLAQTEYTYGSATPEVPGTGGDNTSLLITSKGQTSTYDGSVTVRYHRTDLSDLVTLVPVSIRGYNITTLLGVAQRLNALYGLNFTADDIVDGPANLVDGAGTVTLVAKETSIRWVGQVDITLTLGDRPIGDFLTVTRLPGLNYPAPTTEKPYAAVYAYWRDFSTEQAGLSTVQVGSAQIAAVLAALINVTGDAWSSSEAQRFSLMGASVTYAGDTSGSELSNTDYDKVIIVQLNETNSVGLSGSLIIHYNLP